MTGRLFKRSATGAALLSLVIAASWPMPSAAQLFTDTESRKAVAAQQQQIAELTRLLEQQSARISQLENALKAQSLLELLNQVEALQAEVRRLRGQQEVLSNSIDTAGRRQRDMYIDVDSRLKRIETAKPAAPAAVPPATGVPSAAAATAGAGAAAAAGQPAAAGAAAAAPPVAGAAAGAPGPIIVPPSAAGPMPGAASPAGTRPAQAAGAAGAPTSGAAAPAVATAPPAAAPAATAAVAAPPVVIDPAEQRAYDSAHQLRRIGNFAGAITEFQAFIKTWPKSRLAPSAQYWIGDSHFNLREFRTAISSQRQLIATWPADDKVPDALFNIASAQAELNETAAARKTLEEVVARYPSSDAADRARRRLAAKK